MRRQPPWPSPERGFTCARILTALRNDCKTLVPSRLTRLPLKAIGTMLFFSIGMDWSGTGLPRVRPTKLTIHSLSRLQLHRRGEAITKGLFSPLTARARLIVETNQSGIVLHTSYCSFVSSLLGANADFNFSK